LEKSSFKFQYLKTILPNEYIEIEFSNEIIEKIVPYNIFYLIEFNIRMFPIIPPKVYCLTNVKIIFILFKKKNVF